MLKNTVLVSLLIVSLYSCQKEEASTTDPLPPAIPEDYLVKVLTESRSVTGSATKFSNIDSLVYDQKGRLVGNRFTYFQNDVQSTTNQVDYRYQGNQIFFSYNGGIESRTATLDAATGFPLSINHVRNFKSSPTDSILWADETYEYDAAGFQKKRRVDVKVVSRSSGVRVVIAENGEDTLINDGKNIVRKVYIINKSDSAFSSTDGAFINTNYRKLRFIYTYTYTSDSMVTFSNSPYQLGRNNSNMMASETYTVESSTDGGITWSLMSSYPTIFTHEISNRLLQRSVVKEVGNRDVVYTYFYGKR